MKFLSERSLAMKLPCRTSRGIHRESEARRPYTQCYLRREEHLVSAMIPPPQDTHVLLRHQKLQRQSRHRSCCQTRIWKLVLRHNHQGKNLVCEVRQECFRRTSLSFAIRRSVVTQLRSLEKYLRGRNNFNGGSFRSANLICISSPQPRLAALLQRQAMKLN